MYNSPFFKHKVNMTKDPRILFLLKEESRIEAILDKLSEDDNVPWNVYQCWAGMLEDVKRELKMRGEKD